MICSFGGESTVAVWAEWMARRFPDDLAVADLAAAARRKSRMLAAPDRRTQFFHRSSPWETATSSSAPLQSNA